MIRRKCMAVGFVLTVFLLCMTACQMEGNDGNSSVRSRNAVSGAAMSADQVQEDFWAKVDEKLGDVQRRFFHNDVAYFAELQDDEDYDGNDRWVLIQQDPNNKGMTRYEIPELHAVHGIAGDWLYYTTEKQTEETLWRMPIGKTEKREILLPAKKEKLVTMYDLIDMYESIYVSDSCLIFEGEMKDDDFVRLYRYDLQAKKCEPLLQERELIRGDLVFTSEHEMAVFGGQLFIQTDNSLYSLEPESGETTRLMDKKRENYVSMVQCGNSMYITTDRRQIYRYDGEGKKPVCVIKKDIFRKRLEELHPWGDKGEYRDHEINDIYAYENRLYLSITADWSKKKTDQWGSTGFILFYADIENIEELGLEEKLWDSVKTIWGNNEKLTLELPDDFPLQDEVYGPSMTGGIVDGKMILLGDKVVPAYVSSITFLPCMAYDLDTGETIVNPKVKMRNGKKPD